MTVYRDLYADDPGQVKLGNVLLPGVFEGLDVEGELRIDEAEVPGQSGKKKQVQGYDDPTLVLKLRLLTDARGTALEKLKVLTGLFQAASSQPKPYVYRIVSKMTAAWGIREVIFKRLRSSDNNLDDTIRVELEFIENRAVVVQTKKVAAAGKSVVPKGLTQAEMLRWLAGKPVQPAPKAKTPAIDDDLVARR